MRATIDGDRMLARRSARDLRRRYAVDVIVGSRANLRRAGEAAHLLDELVLAVKSRDFQRATAAREILRRAFNVTVRPLDPSWVGGRST